MTLNALMALAVAGLTAAGVVYLAVRSVADAAPSLSQLTQRSDGENSRVYAADGRLLGFVRSDTLRTTLPAERIPERFRQATVAIEDRRFYDHRGVDYKGILRALYNNARRGKVVEGGSTLTMQLVRALYLSRARTVERKIVEAKLAAEMERTHSKRWILTSYLNNVSYGTRGGQQLIGIHAAARGCVLRAGAPRSRLRNDRSPRPGRNCRPRLRSRLRRAPSRVGLHGALAPPPRSALLRGDRLRVPQQGAGAATRWHVPIHVAQLLRDSRAERLALDRASRDSGLGLGP